MGASSIQPRVKTRAMQAEMPKRYWKNLPEAAVIPALLNEAPRRVQEMVRRSRAKTAAAPPVEHPANGNENADLDELRESARHCRACPLYQHATQTVFGEGPRDARIVFVGEQPGDQEDKEGHPFVGPAGQLFDRALEDAGIDRSTAYVTNAVKHFKWERRGQRRIHSKPSAREVKACRPQVLVLLGSTAAQSLLGPHVRVLRDRNRVIASEYCERTLVTVHPSSLLRAPDEAARESGYTDFVRDLRHARKLLEKVGSAAP